MSDDEGTPVRIHAHPGLCKGWGNCHRWAPEVYPLDDDGIIAIHRVEVPGEHGPAARLGASVCPERAITVLGPPDGKGESPPTTSHPIHSAAGPADRSTAEVPRP